jgi:hypothetical protein
MKRIVILSTVTALLLILGVMLCLQFIGGSGASVGGDSRFGNRSSGASASGTLTTGTVSSAHYGVNSATIRGNGKDGKDTTGIVGTGRSNRVAGASRSGADGDSSTNSAAVALTPAILKQRAMKQLFAAAMRGSTREMWQSLKEAGVTLSYDDYLRYLKNAKLRGLAVDRVDGAWDQLLQFWARKDPAAALTWAQANQLHAGYGGPDEIFYRMVSAWGSENPEAAAAYAQGIPEFSTTTRGQDVLTYLNGMTNRMSRLELLTAPVATLTPEQRRDLAMTTASLYGMPDSQVADVAKWLIANRTAIDPSTWERAMGTLAPRMTEIPVFDLISLVQSIPTTPGSQSVRSGLLSAIASRDPQTALSMAGDRESDRISVLQQWSQNNPADALRWVLNLPDPKTATPYLGVIVRNLDLLMRFPPIEGAEFPNPETIMQTVERLRGAGGYSYNQACEWAARTMLAVDVNKAFELAARSGSPNAMENLLGEWVRSDPAATLAWVNAHNDAAAYAAAVKSVFPQVVRRDLDAAIAWSRQLQDRSLWLETVSQLLPLTPYERWGEVIGGSQAAFREPDIAAAAMAGAVRLGFNDFEGSCIAVDEVMRRMGLGETDAERQANWARQPASVTTAFENSQQQLIAQLSSHDPQSALAWAEQWPWAYTNGASLMNSLRFAYNRWESDGSGKAQDWLNASKFSEEQRRAIKPQTVYSDPGMVVPVGANSAILTTKDMP